MQSPKGSYIGRFRGEGVKALTVPSSKGSRDVSPNNYRYHFECFGVWSHDVCNHWSLYGTRRLKGGMPTAHGTMHKLKLTLWSWQKACWEWV